MNQSKIPTIIGIVILVAGLALGVFLIRTQNIFRLGATAEAMPKDVRITNITDTSLSVSWTTDKKTTGFITWGESEGKMGNVDEDELQGDNYTHYVTVIGLSPQTPFFFKINSDGADFDNNGIPWKTQTGPAINTPSSSSTISGNLLTAQGTPAENALIYVTVGGASALSTTTSKDGSWVITISPLRTSDLTSAFNINENTDVIEISAIAGPEGTSSAEIYLMAARPVPPMILGQTHNYKNAPTSTTGELPKATLELPQTATRESKFESEGAVVPSAKTVSITSIDEGESISSERPEFFGEGPAGTTITITVESETVSGTTNVSSNGLWSWSPPQNLEPGSHKITISWTDVNGIVRSVSRTFIVQASEVPAYEATPSATPTQTPTPAPTSTPTSTPRGMATPTPTPGTNITPTPSASASATPKPSATALGPSPTAPPAPPESGTGMPTILLFGLGTILLLLGFFGGYSLFMK